MSFFSDCFGRSKKFRQIRNRRSSRPSSQSRPKLELQTLEDRVVPAVTAVLNGSTLNIGFGTASDAATVTTDTLGNIIVNGTGLTAVTTPAASITQITATGTSLTDNETLTIAPAATISAGLSSTLVTNVAINGPLNVPNLSINATDISSNVLGNINVGTLAAFVNTDAVSTLGGAFTGPGSVSHDGAGTLTLLGNNTGLAGSLTSNNGTLKVSRVTTATIGFVDPTGDDITWRPPL